MLFFKTLTLTTLLTLLQTISASPIELVERGTSCTVTTSNFSSLSDIKDSCTSIVIDAVTVPAGKTLDLTGLQDGTTVTFKGTTTFGYKEWDGPLIEASGNGVTITGASGHLINGQGAKWWDGKGSNGGKTKPKFFSASKLKKTSYIKNLNIKNTPRHAFSISNSDSLTIDTITLDNSAGDSTGGHNTDAFDVGNSNNIVIQNSVVKNQDDCLAVNSGTGIKFYNNKCSGGHGISIGSVGGRSNNVVKDVHVKGCTISDSDNGVRIKTVYGATGSVSDVTYEDITLSGIAKYGIVIEGDYENGSPTGTPTSGVPITDLTVTNVHGSVESSAQPIYILVKGASDWTFSEIDITGGKSKKSCTGIPSGAGVSC